MGKVYCRNCSYFKKIIYVSYDERQSYCHAYNAVRPQTTKPNANLQCEYYHRKWWKIWIFNK